MTESDLAKNFKPKREHIDNTQLLAESGCNIVHINNLRFNRRSLSKNHRNMTVAYQRINKSHYKIATAVCHKADTFTKKIGTKTAIENFLNNKTIIVPADPDLSPADQFFDMFGHISAPR